jgi:transposase
VDTLHCQGCQQRDLQIAALQQQVSQLREQVRELQLRLNRDATNSSLPPSANPPHGRKPVVKKRTGRRQGSQPGHSPHLRLRLPEERLQRTITFVPKHCQHCQAPLPGKPSAADPQPTWHQVAELPEITAQVIEYQGHGRCCPQCGAMTWAKIPDDIRARSIGPRLTAVMALLTGCHHVSRRGVEAIVETVFGVPVALGTVASLEQETSQALAVPQAEAVEAVQQAATKNVDETGWKQAGHKRWLWASATTTVVAFAISISRGLAGLTALLGEAVSGIITSDRWGTYHSVPVAQRQLCWAHLKRDFQKCVDRGGLAAEWGRLALRLTRRVFRRWYAFRGGGLDRDGLQTRMQPLKREMRALLEAGMIRTDQATATLCKHLLKLEPALWTFVHNEGVEPTNNHIERLLRPAVLWRRTSFGSWSAEGCRFVERILSVTQTLRLQGRPVLPYLYEAIVAHRAGQSAPKLLPSG